MTGIAVLIITKELPGLKLRPTEEVESVKILCSSGESDVRDKIRVELIDNLLLHLIDAILVKWRRHHNVDSRLAVKVEERADHLGVVGGKVSLVPLERLAIVCAEHNDDNIWLIVAGLFILGLDPVRIVALFECGSATDAKVDNFVIARAVAMRKHVLKLDWVRVL